MRYISQGLDSTTGKQLVTGVVSARGACAYVDIGPAASLRVLGNTIAAGRHDARSATSVEPSHADGAHPGRLPQNRGVVVLDEAAHAFASTVGGLARVAKIGRGFLRGLPPQVGLRPFVLLGVGRAVYRGRGRAAVPSTTIGQVSAELVLLAHERVAVLFRAHAGGYLPADVAVLAARVGHLQLVQPPVVRYVVD